LENIFRYNELSEGCTLTGTSKERFKEAYRVAKSCDAAIMFMGNSVPETEGEQRDRCNLDLPGVQLDLIKEICDVGIPVIVALINGSPITMINWVNRVNAIVEAWHPVEEGGNVIADVLFGINPVGKLPINFKND